MFSEHCELKINRLFWLRNPLYYTFYTYPQYIKHWFLEGFGCSYIFIIAGLNYLGY
jgi:hypothetical protein